MADKCFGLLILLRLTIIFVVNPFYYTVGRHNKKCRRRAFQFSVLNSYLIRADIEYYLFRHHINTC